MATTILEGGKYELSVDNVLIEPELLGDITVNYEEGVKERTTQIGTIRTPSGTVETAEATFVLYLPNIDYLKNIFPENYNAATGSGSATRTGNLKFGGSNCATYNAHIFNIHPTCEGNDNNDWHFSGVVNRNINPTLNGTDDVQVELTVQMQIDETTNAMLMLGTGDLTKTSKWDVTTKNWVSA